MRSNFVDDSDDPQVHEAQAAERLAQSLAAEAQRTWAETQKATAAIRRDRGFGQQQQSTSSTTGCFRRGGQHFARDCPDRSHPRAKRRAKDRYTHYVDHDHYFVGKGKGKFKSKGRQACPLGRSPSLQ